MDGSVFLYPNLFDIYKGTLLSILSLTTLAILKPSIDIRRESIVRESHVSDREIILKIFASI